VGRRNAEMGQREVKVAGGEVQAGRREMEMSKR
jgi:hypothetical protein